MHDDWPALLGGTPVRPEGPPAWPMPNDAIALALQTAYADGSWGQYHGPNVAALEEALAQHHDVAAAFTVASGTMAVEAALRAAGVGAGDHVLMAAYDYEPSFLSVHALGALPVLVDTNHHNACLNVDLIAEAITPQTKAILATHLHGGLVEMPKLMAWANAHRLPVVEDAAQATGATVAGRRAGSSGTIGVLSFGGSKLLTAGRGGALLVPQAALAPRVKMAIHRGIQHAVPMSELQAAVLRPQLQALSERTRDRHQQAQYLLTLLRDVAGLRPFTNTLPDTLPSYYKVGFDYDEESFGLPRDRFVQAMRAEGIAFDIGFRALHVGRAASRYRALKPLPNAERAGQRIVLLHHPVLSLTQTEIEQVALAVTKTYRHATCLRG